MRSRRRELQDRRDERAQVRNTRAADIRRAPSADRVAREGSQEEADDLLDEVRALLRHEEAR
jgi:hypothetical protein